MSVLSTKLETSDVTLFGKYIYCVIRNVYLPTNYLNMNLADALINFLKKKSTGKDIPAPAGVCPNCWGREEYGGKFYDAVKNHGIDAAHPDKNAGWVQEYAETHLKGIHLARQGDQLVCANCKISYRPE